MKRRRLCFYIQHPKKPDNLVMRYTRQYIIIYVSLHTAVLRCNCQMKKESKWGLNVRDLSLQALEKAKEASRKERTLVRQREQSDKADQINIDLYGSVSEAGVQLVCFWWIHCESFIIINYLIIYYNYRLLWTRLCHHCLFSIWLKLTIL